MPDEKMMERVPQKPEFKFYGIGTVVGKETEMPEDGVRRTTLILESNEEVGEGYEPNRARVFFRGPAAVEAAKVERGETVAVEGGLTGQIRTDKSGMERAFPTITGRKIEAVAADEPQGFAFQARGIVAREPSYSESQKGTAMSKVILERQYNGFLGPQASDIEITAFRTSAMTLREAQSGQEVYVEGAVRSRTYEANGQTRWTTDLMTRDAIVLDTPQAKVGKQVEAPSAAAAI